MSVNGLAYHTVVNAMEAASGWTPQLRFRSAVLSSLDGHLPYERYYRAGHARRKANTGADAVERDVQDWLSIDLNPVVQIIRSQSNSSQVVRLFNTYNAMAKLGVRTVAAPQEGSSVMPPTINKRSRFTDLEDQEHCRLGTYLVLSSSIDIVSRNNKTQALPKIHSLSDIATNLDVAHSASAETATVFEMEGYISVSEVARKIGCHQRTLERRLQKEGLTAETIRTATRLNRATKRLRSDDSLTVIAIEEGFSDQAQMSRAFRQSCGMTPSSLRMSTELDF